jgi:hypothetical protein
MKSNQNPSMLFLVELEKLILKMYVEMQWFQNNQEVLRKKKNNGVALPDFRTCYKLIMNNKVDQ